MEGVREFLEAVRKEHLVKGNFRGLLRIVIGHTLTKTDGTVISTGLTWRQISELLRQIRWDKELVRELDLDPDTLPPRDRQRYWFTAISSAKVDSMEAIQQVEALAPELLKLGYVLK